jgi:dolichyl-diphosphooligosaccharide--protein glycosyltransferase
MFTAYFTQARFGYYLAVAGAVLVAYGMYGIIKAANIETASFETIEDLKNIKGYQVIALVLIVFLFLPVNVVAIGNNPNMQPAWNSVRGGADQVWHNESMGWMADNTPEIPMEFNDVWDIPADEDFEYPVSPSTTEGAYGVMSWWDYGHWIQMSGERIPNANPFQEGNYVSSLFFTAQSEERADLLLEALPSVDQGKDMVNMSNEELRSIVENQTDQERYEDTRYIVIDDQMAAGKFGAIATWTDFGEEVPIYGRQEFNFPQQNNSVNLPTLGSGYENTTLSRLYYDDADEMDGYRLVHETETYSLIGSLADLSQRESRPSINRRFARSGYNDSSVLGIPLSQVNQLPDNQMIQAGGGSYLYDFRGVASVKTYERVEGATITGQANVSEPRNVTAFVQMRTTNTERTFPYTERTETDADGNFEMTVPYPTVDDVPVEEGGTNASVEATGEYEIYVGNVGVVSVLGNNQVVGQAIEAGEVDVRESEVYAGEEIEVTLEEVETQQNQTATNGNATDTSGGETDATSGDGATDGTTNDTGAETTDNSS